MSVSTMVRSQVVSMTEHVVAGDLEFDLVRDAQGFVVRVLWKPPGSRRLLELPVELVERLAAAVEHARRNPEGFRSPYDNRSVCAVHGYLGKDEYACRRCEEAEKAEVVANRLVPGAAPVDPTAATGVAKSDDGIPF